MKETERLASQLEHSLNGEAWHGPAILELMQGVTAANAAATPVAGWHSIWELVHHPAAAVAALQALEPDDLKGLSTENLLRMARELKGRPEDVPTTLMERLSTQEAELLASVAAEPSPPAVLPDLCVLAIKYVRLERDLAEVQRELNRLQNQGDSGAAMMAPLEERFPAFEPSGPAPDGIIVLGGALDPNRSQARDKPIFVLSGERLSVAAELAERYPTARVIFTGGTGRLLIERIPEAFYAAPVLERLGVQRERLIVEDRSRNTVENAVYTAAMIDPMLGMKSSRNANTPHNSANSTPTTFRPIVTDTAVIRLNQALSAM